MDGRFVNVMNVGRKNLPTENKREMNTGKIKNAIINESIGRTAVVTFQKIQIDVATEHLMNLMSRRNDF
jgi:hypothetical protein